MSVDSFPASLPALFAPRSVAVVGASERPGVGRTALQNFTELSFSGNVTAVNPRFSTVLGYECRPSLLDLDEAPDAVIFAVGRSRVPDAVEEAARIGAKAGVVFATGFAEVGSGGTAQQQRIVSAAAENGMAILGPNCQGVIDFTTQHAMYMDRVRPYRPGRVALVAESGSVATSLVNNKRGVRWSHVVSTGNEAVLTGAAFLDYLIDLDEVSVVCCFLETVRDPETFFAACDRAQQLGKAVVVCKTGRTEAARAAVESHSGALAPPDRMVDALFRSHGVIRVESPEELLCTALALQARRRPRGGRVAAMTASGGQIQLLHDGVGDLDLTFPAFDQTTKDRLSEILDPTLPPVNPLDYWGTPDLEENLPRMVRAVAADDIDTIVFVGDFTTQPTGDHPRAARGLETALALAGEVDPLLVVLDFVGGTVPPDDVERALDRGVLLLSGLQPSLRALHHLATSSEPRATVTREPHGARDVLDAVAGLPDGVVSGQPALDLLQNLGMTVPTTFVVDTEDAAVDAARHIGFPVVAKFGDEEVAHKSDRGGVVTGIEDDAALRSAVRRLRAAGAARILVQQQVVGGVELYLGFRQHPELGGFLLLGLGGIWTEVFDDVSLRPLGLGGAEPLRMLHELRGHTLLAGSRGQPPVDVESVVEAALLLDALGTTKGTGIVELDVNPFIVTPTGGVAVDALVVRSAS